MDKETIWFWSKQVLIVVIIISIGLWGVNKFLDVYYKEQILAGPCQLCVKLNPEWQQCYDYMDSNQDKPKINISQINISSIG